jgi:zinc protease
MLLAPALFAEDGVPTWMGVPLPANAPLPPSEAVVSDTLENGFRYYIRYNGEPANRLLLCLVVDAGSVQEREDQKGLAHFLEHMLFRGTERFPEDQLVDCMERMGMQHGPDVNAYTSCDETVYKLRLPADDPELLQTAMDILEDWAFAATLDPDAVDSERGVIIEEKRTCSQNVSGRVREEFRPVLLGESRYLERPPIGDMETIRDATSADLREFYETWYRPGLMAVVAVGDIEPDTVEQLIIDRFGDHPAAEDPVPRPEAEIPGHDRTRFAVITDPEASGSSVNVVMKRPYRIRTDIAGLRQINLEILAYEIIRRRLGEMSRTPESPVISAGIGDRAIARDTRSTTLWATVREGREAEALDSLLTTLARMRRWGVTATELQRVIRDEMYISRLAHAELDNRLSADRCNNLINRYLHGVPIASESCLSLLSYAMLPGFVPEDIRRFADSLDLDSNCVVRVVMPEEAGLEPPGRNELAAVIDSVENREVSAYVDSMVDGELMAEPPGPGRIVSDSLAVELGTMIIELENGVRVIMKPTDFRESEVIFAAVSPGGYSLYGRDDFLEASNVCGIVSASGMGHFSIDDLVRITAGSCISVTPYINELWEGLSGEAAPDDLEMLMQAIHLTMTAPRLSREDFGIWMDNQLEFLRNRHNDPYAAVFDAMAEELFGGDVRYRVPTVEEMEALDLNRAYEIYNDRFGDASDFTFIFVGSFDPDRLGGLARTYLGSLPAAGREESWRDVMPACREQAVQREMFAGSDSLGLAMLLFSGTAEQEWRRWAALSGLQSLLQMRLDETLRDSLSGAYGVWVSVDVPLRPRPHYSLSVAFATDPDRLPEMTQSALGVLARAAASAPDSIEMAKLREQALRRLEENMESNQWWLSQLQYYAYPPEGRSLRDMLEIRERMESLTADDILTTAERLLDRDRCMEFAVYPEWMADSVSR